MIRVCVLLIIMTLWASSEVKSISEYSDEGSFVLRKNDSEIYFLDDVTNLRLTKIKTYLIENNGVKLVIEINVADPLLDPVPGFSEKRGFNQMASSTLTKIEQNLSFFKILDKKNKEVKYTNHTIRGTVSKRALRGTEIDYDIRSAETPLKRIYTADVNYDEDILQLQFNKTVRLKVYLKKQPLFKSAFTNDTGKKKPVVIKDIKLNTSGWDNRDLRAKWIFVRQSLEETPSLVYQWAEFLKEKKEFALVEKLIFINRDGFDLSGLGKFLIDNDAPHWPRITAWIELSKDKHSKASLENAVSSRIGVYTFFKEKYEINTSVNITGPVEGKEDISKYLKPADLDNELKTLLKNDKFSKFPKNQLTAEKEKVYYHELFTAIDYFNYSFKPDRKRIAELAEAQDDRVAVYALLSFTKLGYKDRNQIPKSFRKLVNAPKVSKDRASSALMAYSFRPDMEAFLLLHEILKNAKHAAWKTAVSRLGDIGNEFTLKMIKDLNLTNSLDEDSKNFLIKEKSRIEERVLAEEQLLKSETHKKMTDFLIGNLTGKINAYSKDSEHVMAVSYKEWLIENIKGLPQETVINAFNTISRAGRINEKGRNLIFELRKQIKN